MNYTIDTHIQRIKQKDEDGKPIIEMTDDAGKVVKDPDKYLKENPGLKLKPAAKVKETPGFIIRADDAFVAFVETKEEAIKRVEKEQRTPSILPGMTLTIESHVKREKQFDKDEKPILDENGKIKIKLTPGFNLRNDNKVIAFREKRADLVAMIQKVSGIEDPVVAEEKAKPQRPDKKRERKT